MCLAVSTATRPYTTEMKVQSQRAAGVCECERYMNSTRSGKYKSKKMEAEKNNESGIAAERWLYSSISVGQFLKTPCSFLVLNNSCDCALYDISTEPNLISCDLWVMRRREIRLWKQASWSANIKIVIVESFREDEVIVVQLNHVPDDLWSKHSFCFPRGVSRVSRGLWLFHRVNLKHTFFCLQKFLWGLFSLIFCGSAKCSVSCYLNKMFSNTFCRNVMHLVKPWILLLCCFLQSVFVVHWEQSGRASKCNQRHRVSKPIHLFRTL